MTIAVEVGGTFTDLIWLDAAGYVRTHKVPSVPQDPSIGVIAGLEEGLGNRLPRMAPLVHGSTVATNAVLERTGCRAGLLTTLGFGDLLITQRQLRDNVYSIVSQKPVPIVPPERGCCASSGLLWSWRPGTCPHRCRRAARLVTTTPLSRWANGPVP